MTTTKLLSKPLKKKWGANVVIGDVTQAAYLGPWLWKAAVEKAGSFDIDKIKKPRPILSLKLLPKAT